MSAVPARRFAANARRTDNGAANPPQDTETANSPDKASSQRPGTVAPVRTACQAAEKPGPACQPAAGPQPRRRKARHGRERASATCSPNPIDAGPRWFFNSLTCRTRPGSREGRSEGAQSNLSAFARAALPRGAFEKSQRRPESCGGLSGRALKNCGFSKNSLQGKAAPDGMAFHSKPLERLDRLARIRRPRKPA